MPRDLPPLPDPGPAAPSATADAGCLPRGYRLRDFVIERVLAEGGFGVVYVAIDPRLQRRVAIKEYMPASLARRNGDLSVQPRSSVPMQDAFAIGLRSFINEARMLAGFDHPALVRVLQFWEDKGTGFMVMPLYQAPTVRQWTLAREAAPDPDWLQAFIERLLEALELVHGVACLHRDIAPDNILLQRESDPLLLDFGAARRVLEEITQTLTAIVKPGYAPIEQYAQSQGLRQGPWTDLYALSATLHFMLTRRAPQPAVARVMADEYVPLAQALRGRYPSPLLAAIDAGLAVRPGDRPPSATAFRALLRSSARVWPVAGPCADSAPVRADAAAESRCVTATQSVESAAAVVASAATGRAPSMLAGGAIERPTASLAELLFSRPLSARTAAATLACATLLSTLAFWPRSEAPLPGNNEGVADRTASEREVVATAIQPISRPVPESPAAAAEAEVAPMHDDVQPGPPPRAAAPRKDPVEAPARRAAPPAAVTPAHGAPKRSGEAQPVAAPEAVAAPAAALNGPAMAAVDRAAAEHPPQPGTTPLQPAAEPVAAPDPAPTATPLLAIEKPAPQFPPEAARDGIEHGRVVARLHVAADGRIGRVDILSSTPRATFDRSVRSAVRQWRYQPPGHARTVVVEFEFRLES